MLQKTTKIILTLMIISTLVINFNFINYSKASPIKSGEDGVWLDYFTDDTGLENLNNVTVKNNSLTTEIFERNVEGYTFPNEGEHKAYKNSKMVITPTSKGYEPYLPPTKKILGETALSDSELDALGEDEEYVVTEPFSWRHNAYFSAANRFSFTVDESAKYVDKLDFTWSGDYEKTDEIQIYAWKYSGNDLIENIGEWIPQIDINDSETQIEANIENNASMYIGPENTIDFLIVAIPEDSNPEKIGFDDLILYTDKVSLNTGVGNKYYKTADAISKPISPKKISSISNDDWRWEKIFWQSQNIGNDSIVKIQVLDKDMSLISEDDITGNKNGFTSSPLDISSLDVAYETIHLKALFECNDRTETAILYNWAVTWQNDRNSFSDSFSTLLRIDKKYGAEHESSGLTGYFEVSKESASWPMFGKNSDNNRVYFGEGPEKFKVYWQTEKFVNINPYIMLLDNLFCSPVISEDKVFMPFSTDQKIYSYSLIKDLEDKKQKLVNETKEIAEKFEMSPLATDDLIIIGTSALETKNKLYAFNKSNLKQQIWNWEDKDETTISYSASPVYDDGKIFVSSWDGKGSTCPPIDLAEDYINSYDFLENLFGEKTSGKITVLDESDGSFLWSKNLPAASFSTPAVYKNTVYVGCENMKGGSLFAFDKNTGEELWNTSVGIIGRSSPVVYHGNVYVLTKTGPLAQWTDKFVSIDAETGSIEWEKELSTNFGLQSIPKNLLSFTKQIGKDRDTVDYLTMRDIISSSTPVLDNGTAYITSTDGTLNALNLETHEKTWNVSLSQHKNKIFDFYFASSPAMADGYIYSLTNDGWLYCVNAEGSVEWKEELSDDADLSFSSPVIANGLVICNYIDNLDSDWALTSIGDYKENSQSKIISSKISTPVGNWWKKFSAEYQEKDGSIVFSILNENGKKVAKNLDGNDNDISNVGIDSRYIYLSADIKKTDSISPVLERWSISWGAEEAAPEFEDEFVTISGESYGNFYGPDSKEISINVFDKAHKRDSTEVLSGIDGESVRYRVGYIDNEGKNKDSDWLVGLSSEGSGVENSKLVAKLADIIKNTENARVLKNITFRFSDLAGNKATSNAMTAKIDVGKPSSSMKTEPVINRVDECIKDLEINVTASDKAGESLLNEVKLKYRYSEEKNEWTDWKNLTILKSDEPLVYTFKAKKGSGYYQVKSLAVDNVGNIEEKTDADLEFKFDDTQPDIETDEEEINLKELPLTLHFKDDLEIDDIEYSLNKGLDWDDIPDLKILPQTKELTWNLTKEFIENLRDEQQFISMDIRITDTCGNFYILENLSVDISGETSEPDEDKIAVLNLDDFSDIQWDDEFKIAADIPDDVEHESVKLFYKYSSDKKDWGEWKQVGSSKTTDLIWDFKAEDGNGYYQFKTEITTADEVIESRAEKATVSIFPTIPIILLVIVIIVLMITSLFVFLRMRKKKLES